MLAQGQHGAVVLAAVEPLVLFDQRAVVDLQRHMVLKGSLHQPGVIQRGVVVVRVGHQLHLRVFHALDEVCGVAVSAFVLVAQPMDAHNGIIQLVDILLFQREPAAVEHIDLAPVQDLHTVDHAGDHAQVPVIERVHRSGDARGMLTDADELQLLFLCGRCHLPDGAIGMAAGKGVHVDVCDQTLHRFPPFSGPKKPERSADRSGLQLQMG